MSVKIVFEIKEISERVTQLTINMSDPVGTKELNTSTRIADVIPMTKSEESTFDTLLYEAGARVLEKLGAYTQDVDYPYQVTDETDPEFPLSIIYEIELYSGAKEGVVLPIVQQAILETLMYYIGKEWVKLKGFPSTNLEMKYEQAETRIKSGLKYGQRAKLKFRDL